MENHKEAKLKQFLEELRQLTWKFGIIVEHDKECKTTLFDCPEVVFGHYEVDVCNGYWINLRWVHQ